MTIDLEELLLINMSLLVFNLINKITILIRI